jgi:hypothetical protein
MSFLGLAMSPQESSIAADAGGGASDSISDSGSDSDTTASQEDSGAADSSSSEGGGLKEEVLTALEDLEWISAAILTSNKLWYLQQPFAKP